jgi:hypothetical protein
MLDRRELPQPKKQALRAAFDKGCNPYNASQRTGVSQTTVYRYYWRWGWQRPPRHIPTKPKFYGLPVYTGPDWIG